MGIQSIRVERIAQAQCDGIVFCLILLLGKKIIVCHLCFDHIGKSEVITGIERKPDPIVPVIIVAQPDKSRPVCFGLQYPLYIFPNNRVVGIVWRAGIFEPIFDHNAALCTNTHMDPSQGIIEMEQWVISKAKAKVEIPIIECHIDGGVSVVFVVEKGPGFLVKNFGLKKYRRIGQSSGKRYTK